MSSQSFYDDLFAFGESLKAKYDDAFIGITTHVGVSVKDGSAVTGAPGQPVDTSNLINSYIERYPERDQYEVSTNVVYAPAIEEGIQYVRVAGGGVATRPLNLLSPVGGSHSVALTRAGYDLIVEHEVAKVAGP